MTERPVAEEEEESPLPSALDSPHQRSGETASDWEQRRRDATTCGASEAEKIYKKTLRSAQALFDNQKEIERLNERAAQRGQSGPPQRKTNAQLQEAIAAMTAEIARLDAEIADISPAVAEFDAQRLATQDRPPSRPQSRPQSRQRARSGQLPSRK